MRGLYKKYRKLLFATIPFAFILSGIAGASLRAQGLTMLFALIVSLGSLIYAVIVSSLLATIEEINAELDAHERAERDRIQAERDRKHRDRMSDYFK